MKQYTLFSMAKVLSAVIPRPFAYWLSLRVADQYFFRDAAGRAAVMSNLRRVLEYGGRHPSERELSDMARRIFQNFGKYLVDFFRFSGVSQKKIARLVTVEHREYLEEAKAMGRGVLVVTAHLGNWEIGGLVMSSMGYPMYAVTLQQKLANVNSLFQSYRRRRGLSILPLGSAVRSIVRLLKRNECVALVADRDFSSHDGAVEFFGAPAHLPRGPAWLCSISGAPILPGFLLRRPDDTFVLRFHPLIVPEAGVAVEMVQRRICAILQDEISGAPTQWLMFRDIWEGGEAPADGAARKQGL